MSLRNSNIDKLADQVFDVLIIGGGINGAVSAAALAARGLKVGLIDRGDFAGFTSQHSSNLIWGGIKYMENYEFGLVNSLCRSRNQLMRSFPSVVKEIRFLTTVSMSFRHHPLMLFAGSWLYWLFGRGFTRPPKVLSAKRIARQESIVDVTNSDGGVEYSDAYLCDNDARFVFNFIRSALDQGCIAANYVESLGANRSNDELWLTQARDTVSGRTLCIRSKVLVNAAGAFVDQHNGLSNVVTRYSHVFSKGIHLIVPQITKSHRVLAFFADDGRLFFAIPMANRTCIGTTDTRVKDAQTSVTDEDRDFVLSNINTRLNLAKPLRRDDIIAERCGVRPLAVPKGSQIESEFLQMSRKHIVDISVADRHISIFGGKLTDCINVGDEVCAAVAALGLSLHTATQPWYGECQSGVRDTYFKRAADLGVDQVVAQDTGEVLSARLWRRYGVNAPRMLDRIAHDWSLSEPAIAGTGLCKCELKYLASHEMIVTLEDLLRRRSKIGLLTKAEDLKTAPGMMAVCEALFGAQHATERYNEYFSDRIAPMS